MPAESDESVETVRGILDTLVSQRQRLRAFGDTQALEANRLAIVYWQQALSRLLFDAHRS